MTPGSQTRMLFVLACACGVLIAGCRGEPDESAAPRPFVGEVLDVARPGGQDLEAAWQPIVDEWQERTGAVCRIQTYEPQVGPGDLVRQLDGSEAGAERRAPALFIVPLTAAADLAAAQLLAEVPEGLRSGEGSLEWFDIFQGLRDNLASLDGKPQLLPLSCPVLVCYYRRDLLEAAGLSPPETWDDYRRLLDTVNHWAPGMTVVEPWSEEFRATMFQARAAAYAKHAGNYSLYFDIRSMEPLIAGPGFVRALERAQSDVQKMPKEVLTYSPDDCRRQLFEGRAAMAVSYETGTTGSDGLDRPASMSIGIARLPGAGEVYNYAQREWGPPPQAQTNHVALVGFEGYAAGVSAHASPADQQAAWNLLLALTAPENLANAFPGSMKSLCRESQRSDALFWVGFDLNASEKSEMIDVVAECLQDMRLAVELPVTNRDKYRSALTSGLTAVLNGEADPDSALETVAGQWRQITQTIGVDKLGNSYRRSLSLPVRTGQRR